MKSDCYFEECKHCANKEYNDNLYCCLVSRVNLVWHRLLKEMPIIKEFISDNKYCNWYQKDAIVEKQLTYWTLGWGLEAELGFDDGRYLPRKAAMILYPEYFDENGEPILDMLPFKKLDKR